MYLLTELIKLTGIVRKLITEIVRESLQQSSGQKRTVVRNSTCTTRALRFDLDTAVKKEF